MVVKCPGALKAFLRTFFANCPGALKALLRAFFSGVPRGAATSRPSLSNPRHNHHQPEPITTEEKERRKRLHKLSWRADRSAMLAVGRLSRPDSYPQNRWCWRLGTVAFSYFFNSVDVLLLPSAGLTSHLAVFIWHRWQIPHLPPLPQYSRMSSSKYCWSLPADTNCWQCNWPPTHH